MWKCCKSLLNEELTNENSDVIENVVSESTDEIAECSDNEMLMCVYELERRWKDSIVVEWGQRVNFPFSLFLDLWKCVLMNWYYLNLEMCVCVLY